MKVVILAGGMGTRISEESHLRPKPMIEIGESPILWHIMKIYSHYGLNDFIICCGYKQYVVKEYFANFFLHNSDITFDFRLQNHMVVHKSISEPWRVTVVDTGRDTNTAGRIRRIQNYVQNETFMMTYGDGVSNVDISKLLDFHNSHGNIATVTAVQPEGKLGSMLISEENQVTSFREKIRGDGNWINAGFFVFNPGIFDYLTDDYMDIARAPMENLSADGQLCAFQHPGFWQPMDTLRDKVELDAMWADAECPWRVWE